MPPRKRDATAGVFLPVEESEEPEAEEQPGEDLPRLDDDTSTDQPSARDRGDVTRQVH